MTGPADEQERDLGIEGFEGAVEVGRGGFAVVYRARQPALNRQVAIKVLAPADTTNQRRFEREGWAMGTLSGHPNIVNVLETGITSAGQPYIVMTYLAHGSLADRVGGEGALPWPEVCRIGVKLAGALEAAHRSGTLHRDVKPENVLLSDYGEPLLSDFGIARVEGHAATTEAGLTASVAHAAPELLDGDQPSVACDVYALGSTLFTLLSGRAPFARREGEQLVGQAMRIATEPVDDLRPRGVPSALCRVVEQAMAKDPAERQPSALELGRQLQEAQRQGGLPVTDMALVLPGGGGERAGAVGSGESGSEPDEPGSDDETEDDHPVSRDPVSRDPVDPTPATATPRRAPLTAALVLAVLVGLAALLTLAGGGGENDLESNAPSTPTASTEADSPEVSGHTVAVGDDPTAVVSAKIDDRPYLFVANANSRTVSVIDATTEELVTSIELDSRPTGMAVNPRSRQLFVTSAEAALTVVDGTTFRKLGSVALPDRATAITVDHRQNLVYLASSTAAVWVVDGSTSELLATVELPATPAGIDINPQTNRIYVTGPEPGVLWIIDGDTGQITAEVDVGPGACGVAVNPRSNRAYVALADSAELVVVSGESDSVEARIAVDAEPCGVALNPSADRIYATSQTRGTVTVVDGAIGAVAGQLHFPPSPASGALVTEISTDPDAGLVYVVSRSSDLLAVLSER